MFRLFSPGRKKEVNYYLRRVNSVDPIAASRHQPNMKQNAKRFVKDFEREVKLNIDSEDESKHQYNLSSKQLNLINDPF